MVAQIKQEDKEFQDYKIAISDFVDLTETAHKNEYRRAQAITKNLVKKYAEITLPNGDILQTTFLSHAKYKKGEGYVEVSFSPKLKPYLLEIKKNFTSYDIRNILPLKSKYTLRIYELMKQFRTVGERIFPLDELRNLLSIPESYTYGRIKEIILTPAKKELYDYTDLFFTFEEIKQGRKVTSIRFEIHKKKVTLSNRPSPKLEIVNPDIENNVEKKGENPNPLYDVLEAGIIASNLGTLTYASWFKNIEIILKDDVLEIYFPSKFHANWVSEHYIDTIKGIFTGLRIEIKVNATLIQRDNVSA